MERTHTHTGNTISLSLSPQSSCEAAGGVCGAAGGTGTHGEPGGDGASGGGVEDGTAGEGGASGAAPAQAGTEPTGERPRGGETPRAPEVHTQRGCEKCYVQPISNEQHCRPHPLFQSVLLDLYCTSIEGKTVLLY